MVIDVHVHPEFFEPAYIDDATVEKRKAIMGRDKLGGKTKVSLILKKMDYAGIDKKILLPLDLTTQYGCTIVSNEEMVKVVESAPDRFIGFASVDPFRKDAVEVVEHAFKTLKLNGLHLNPAKQKFYPGDAMMDAIYNKCIEYNKPIMFDAGLSWQPETYCKYSVPLNFEEVAVRFPALRFCLGHFGWPWVQDTAALILKYPNVYADTAMLYMDRPPDFFHQVFKVDLSPLWIENVYHKKVMFGSNEPRFGAIDMKQGIESLNLRQSTTDRILGGNAEVFLGWKEEPYYG